MPYIFLQVNMCNLLKFQINKPLICEYILFLELHETFVLYDIKKRVHISIAPPDTRAQDIF